MASGRFGRAFHALTARTVSPQVGQAAPCPEGEERPGGGRAGEGGPADSGREGWGRTPGAGPAPGAWIRVGLGRGVGWLRGKTRRWVVRHDILIYRKRLVPPLPSHAGFEVFEHRAFQEGVVALHRRLGRELAEYRIRERFGRGHRFYELREGGRTLATTWAVASGERFVDEIALGFPVSAERAWMRDIFVEPASRGRGLFAVLLEAVAGRFFPRAQTLWSAVSARNPESVRAHARFGHEVVVRYLVLHIAGGILLRLRWPPREIDGSSFEPSRRAILTGPSYWRFIAEHRA